MIGEGEKKSLFGAARRGRTLDQRCVVLDIFAPPREEYRQAGHGLGNVFLEG